MTGLVHRSADQSPAFQQIMGKGNGTQERTGSPPQENAYIAGFLRRPAGSCVPVLCAGASGTLESSRPQAAAGHFIRASASRAIGTGTVAVDGELRDQRHPFPLRMDGQPRMGYPPNMALPTTLYCLSTSHLGFALLCG